MAVDSKVLLFHDDIDHGNVDGPDGVGDKDGKDDIDGVVQASGDDKVESDRNVDVRQQGDPLVFAVQSPLDGASDPT